MSGVYLYAVLGARPASDCGVGLCAERLRIVVVGDLIAVVGDVPMTPEVTAMTLRTQDKFYEAIRSMGEAAQATIVSATETGVLVNGENPLMKFQLEVHPNNRPLFQAETQGVISQASKAKYQPGQTVWVKFNPNDLTQVALDHS